MERMSQYVSQILKGSYLRRKEQNEWREEMLAHLHASVHDLQQQGVDREQAVTQSIERFGTPEQLRKQLTQETFGITSTWIIRLALISLLYALSSLIGGLLLNQYGVHNRYIELSPILGITGAGISLSLLLTRKRMDRIVAVLAPILFLIGTLQAYFRLFIYSTDRTEVVLFKNLFFSGVYDARSASLNWELASVSSMFVCGYALILYLISKNKFVSLLPFVWSIIFAISHMSVIQSYFLFFPKIISPVVSSYTHFVGGTYSRLFDIAMKIMIMLVLYALFICIETLVRYRKRRIA